LERQIDWNEIKTLTKDNAMITTSLIEEKGIDNLEAALADLFFSSEVATDEAAYISNVRHIQLLKQAKLALEDATNALELNMPLDIVQIDIRRTGEFLGEIIGDTASESLIDQLFSQFCLVKKERVRILTYHAGDYDVIVVGAGHAGCESVHAAAHIGSNTLMLTLNLDMVAFMPCNPSLGGRAKRIVIREIDALGGAMGKVIDKTHIQMRMLNTGKGPAVQSLRAQADKPLYIQEMKRVLENEPNITLRQAMVDELIIEDNVVKGVVTETKGAYYADK